jgi:hypothetical protein
MLALPFPISAIALRHIRPNLLPSWDRMLNAAKNHMDNAS